MPAFAVYTPSSCGEADSFQGSSFPLALSSILAPFRLEPVIMRLTELAETLGCRLEGDAQAEITGVAGLDHAAAGQVSFLANRRYFPLLHSTRASAVFIEEGIRIERDPGLPPLSALRSGNPYLAFAKALELF